MYSAPKIKLKAGVIDDFKNNTISIACKTKSESLSFLRICEEHGLKWSNNRNATSLNFFNNTYRIGIIYNHSQMLRYGSLNNRCDGERYMGTTLKEFNNLIEE